MITNDFRLFTKGPSSQTMLLLWRDTPCIVIGRNQNPWVECNVPLARSLGIPIVRRYSGGGTVYHDLGNSIYSVTMPRAVFDRDRYAHMVVRALSRVPSLANALRVSPRHDIFMGDRKVSGSAYRIVRERAYHHGTLLLNSKLDLLDRLLESPHSKDILSENGKTVGVSSVKSPVTNLGNLSHEDFSSLIIQEFLSTHQTNDSIETDFIAVDEGQVACPEFKVFKDELESAQWTFGATPSFTYKGKMIENGQLPIIDLAE